MDDDDIVIPISNTLDESDECLFFPVHMNLNTPPCTESWQLPTLHKLDARGARRLWNVAFDYRTRELVITHGIDGGQQTENRRIITTNASGLNLLQQAYLEAKSRYTVKLYHDYVPLTQDFNNNGVMRADKYHPDKDQIRFPTIVDLKLDGHRTMVKLGESGEVVYSSRLGLTKTNMQCFDREVCAILGHMPLQAQLDGEVYKHGTPFETISSIVSGGTKKDMEQLELHLFDYCGVSMDSYEVRRQQLEQAYVQACQDLGYNCDCEQGFTLPTWGSGQQFVTCGVNPLCEEMRVKIVPCGLVMDKNDIELAFHQAVDCCYEGIMIKTTSGGKGPGTFRHKNSLYQRKRCAGVYKYKPEMDNEGICLSVRPPDRSRGNCIVEIDFDGIVFRAVMMGSHDESENILANRDSYVGRIVEFKHNGFTGKGVPKFAKVRRFRIAE